MKKIIIMLFICLYFSNYKVSALSHDVQAVFKKSYNVDLVTGMLNSDSEVLKMDDLELEFSTTEENIKIVLINASGAALEYAKTFTNSTSNYYLAFYNNKDEKINLTDIDVQIKNESKVLNIYSNEGKLISKSDEKINLTGNDYFVVLTDLSSIDDSGYKVIDIDSSVSDLKDIDLDNANIEVYNSKGLKIKNTEKLGTNYKIVIEKLGVRKTYTIVVMGDVTGDAKISLNDVTRLYHYYKEIEDMEDVYILAGDVASNEIINLNDITKLYHYYKGIITEL